MRPRPDGWQGWVAELNRIVEQYRATIAAAPAMKVPAREAAISKLRDLDLTPGDAARYLDPTARRRR